MMFPSNRVRVLVSTKPVDFRKGHDGLAALVSSMLRKDPFTGTRGRLMASVTHICTLDPMPPTRKVYVSLSPPVGGSSSP